MMRLILPRTPRLLLVAAVLAACAGGDDTSPSAAAVAGGDSIALGTRVRITTPILWEGWYSGVVDTVGTCLAVMIPVEENAKGFFVIPFDDVTRIAVSSRYDGRVDASGAARTFEFGADTAGETWTERPAAPLARRYGHCAP